MVNPLIANKYLSIRPIYEKLAQKVSQTLEEILELNGINYHAVSYRAKTIESFSQKIKNPKYTDPFSQLTDFAGIRVICYVEDDVEKVSNLIESIFTVDYANSLNKSDELGVDKVGYKSVHYVCALPDSRISLPEYSRFKGLHFEIQVRTILQHSWAEIEHDKNYKFSGELPHEIQRRFKLVAGNLELADREFNALSREIDRYIEVVKEGTIKGDLDIQINSTSLKEYLVTKLQRQIDSGNIMPEFAGYENLILKELRDFGVVTLADLDSLITFEVITAIDDTLKYCNFLGLLRIVMMATDGEKYFRKSFRNDWNELAENDDKFLERLGFDFSILDTFGVSYVP